MKKFILLFFLSIILAGFPHFAFSQNSIFDVIEEYYQTETAKKANQKLAKNDIEGAIKLLDKAIEKKVDLFEAYRTRSFIRHYYKDDIDGAISDLNRALEITPEDVDIYISRAFLKKRFKKDLDGALRDYETAEKYQPKSSIIFNLIAITKKELNDLDGAIVKINEGLKIQPDNIEFRILLTSLLIANNESDKAFDQLQNFLVDYKNKNKNLPKIKGEKVKKKIPSELNDTDGAINSIPVKRYSQKTFNAGSPEELKKQMAEVEEARTLSKAFLKLSNLLVSRNMLDEALVNLDTAIEIDKNQEQAYSLRGAIYLTRGETKKAIDEFDEAINIADQPVFYLNRGIAYLMSGNNTKSQKDFDKFIKLYPAGKTILEQRIEQAKKMRVEKD